MQLLAESPRFDICRLLPNGLVAVETIADHRRLTSDQVEQHPGAVRNAGLLELVGSPSTLADGVAVVSTTAETPH